VFQFLITELSTYQGGAFWLAMRGYTYHRVFPTEYEDQPVHWFLYDAEALSSKACNREVPLIMVEKVHGDLYSRNYLYHAYECFARYKPDEPQAHMELSLARPW
jgi:hypothetical protein